MTKIFITRAIPGQAIKELKKSKGIIIDAYEKDQQIPRKELLKRVKGVNILVPLLTETIDKEVMDWAGAELKMIANYTVGFDNVNVDEAKKRGIVVTNAPSQQTSESVAEHAIALILALSHRIVEADTFTRAGKYKGWDPNLFLGSDIMGKTLGIIGAGRIGAGIARRLHAGFGIKIIYTDTHRNPEFEKMFGAKFKTQTQLLKESDIVTLHVPLLPTTKHLISTKELKLMKKTSILINTSRGPVVDELALIKALSKKQIAGAGLDVYECEPAIDCNIKDKFELRKLSNVILTPHTASSTIQARQAMTAVVVKNISAFIDGKKIPNKIV
ncbi:D-glycerate dehydrogenase [Candidatus Parcubacteria bacterium]|nr:D-glycerate dehydrogenase [Candidatus Parcubacteria bacterium]